jgi:hypothetical protein
MLRLIAIVALLFAALLGTPEGKAAASPNGTCVVGFLGTGLLCGGAYVITPAPAHAIAPSPRESGTHTRTVAAKPAPPLAPYPANGPTGPCIALGPADPTPNATVQAWLATLHLPPCKAAAAGPAPRPIDPAALAVQFWRTIHLPVPQLSIPPGYAVTGMPAYLVTTGTLAPAPYRRVTPLGPLTITVNGTYFVDWGDGTAPIWTGPYRQQGQSYPDGMIVHTYDNATSLTVSVREAWTARWHLGAAAGVLTTLQTGATISNFPVRQIQAVVTG